MTAAAIVPPAPTPPQRLGTVGLIRAMRRNVLLTFRADAYDAMTLRRRLLGRPAVLLNDPAAARRVLVENPLNYVKPIAAGRLVRPFTGDGLLLTEGDAWRAQRRRLAHAFTPASIDQLFPRFQEAADGLLRTLHGRDSVHLGLALEAAALDAVMRALFSSTASAWRHRLNDLVRDYMTGARSPGRPNLFDLLARGPDDFPLLERSRRRFRDRWFAEVDAMIAARRAEGPAAGDPDLLDHLLAARDADTGAPLPPEEVRSQIATFMAAGFETTARLLFWTVYLLALDPAEQDRLREEASTAPDLDGLAALQRLPRLRAVLQEALRLYPPAPLIFRTALAADEAAGEPVPAGCVVSLSPWVMHRHRRLWEQPEAFRPERFEGQPNAYLTGGAFLPFSLGPRVCIGATFAMAEASVLLAALLRSHAFGLTEDTPVMPVASVTLQPDRQPRFRLSPLAAPLRTAA
jgi:cytochrome P450